MSKTSYKELEIYKQNWKRLLKRFPKLNAAIDNYIKHCPVDMGIFLRIKKAQASEMWENMSLEERRDYREKNRSGGNIKRFKEAASTRIDELKPE